MNTFIKIIAVGLFFGFPDILHALTLPELTKDSLKTDIPIPIEEITVHAFRYEHKLIETPGAISIISSGQFLQSPGQNIAGTINQVPGVYMQSGSLHTNRLTIRGIGSRSPYSSNKVRAYYEDIPLTNGVGETTIEDLDLAVLSSLEIIKGPASGYYRSGLGGTLLFHQPAISRNIFSAERTLSSFNNQLYRSNLSLRNENIENAFFLERLNADGYRENNQTNRTNLSYIGKLTSGNHNINLIGNYTDLLAYIPSSIDLETFNLSPEEAASNWKAIKGFENYQKTMLGISVQSQWDNRIRTRLSIFGNIRTNNELRPFNRLDEDNSYYGERFIVEKKLKLSNQELKVSLGNESFFEHYDWSTFANSDREKGEQLSDNKERRKYLNLFTQADYLLSPGLRMIAGLNVNVTSYKYGDLYLTDGNQSSNHQFNPIVSPRFAFNYSLLSRLAAYGTVSHGFSPPSLEETLMPDGQRNTNIKPETGWNYELGSRGYLFDDLFFDVSVYYMQINNLLVARRTGEDAYIGINAGRTAHPGIEYSLNYQFLHSDFITSHIMLNGSFSPHYFIDFVDGENDYSGNELTGTPRQQFNIDIDTWLRKRLHLNVQYRYTGTMPLRDDNSVKTGSYGLLNLVANYKLQWEQFGINFSGAICNLTDTHYASMVLINASSFGNQSPRYYYPGLPRNFSARIGVNYLF